MSDVTVRVHNGCVFVNGTFVAAVLPNGQVDAQEDLHARFIASNVVHSLSSVLDSWLGMVHKLADHNNRSESAIGSALLRGLVDGRDRILIPHPYEGVPPIQREQSKAYLQGYELADFLSRVQKLLK